VPIPVRVFIAIDIALGVAYLLTYLAGQPRFLTPFLDLNRENNLPTWYSSVQWFCVAGLLGIFAISSFSFSHKKSWLLLTLPLVFLGLSLDEIATIHERVGWWSDALLQGGSRQNSLFTRTGVWMFLLGAPFAVLFVGLVVSIRSYFRQTPGVLTKLCLGMVLTLTGALGIETLSNFVTPGSASAVLLILAEELCELLGSTIVLWGGYELLAEHGFKLDRVETGRS
jgi:hypothetical protein